MQLEKIKLEKRSGVKLKVDFGYFKKERDWLKLTKKYGLAIVLSDVVIILKLAFPEVFPSTSYVLLYGVVFFTALYGGRGTGFLSIVLTALGHWYFTTDQQFSFSGKSMQDAIAMGSYVLIASAITMSVGALRKSRRRSQDLAEQAQHYAARAGAILESSLDAIIIIDKENRLIDCNPATEKLFGYTRKKLLGNVIFDLILPPEYRIIHKKLVQDYLKKGEKNIIGKRHEIKAQKADGIRFPAELAITPIEVGGDPLFTIYIRNISDRKREEMVQLFMSQASDTLASSLEYKETLRHLASLAVPGLADWCVIDIVTDGKVERLAITHTDPKKAEYARRISADFPPDPAKNVGVSGVIKSGKAQLYSKITPEVLKKSRLDPGYIRLCTELGFVSAVAAPLKAKGKTLGAIGFMSAESMRRFDKKDVRVVEELAARASSAIESSLLYHEIKEIAAKQESILSQVTEGVILFDPTGTVIFINEAAKALVGEFVPNWHITQYFERNEVRSPDRKKADPYSMPLLKALMGETVNNQEYRLKRPDGLEAVILTSSASVKADDGRLYGAVATLRDITERKQLEDQKDEFIYVATHELKTPITSMKAYGQGLLRSAQKRGAAEEEVKILEAIVRQTDRLTRLIRNLLDASKIGSGRLTLDLKDVNLKATITAVCERVRLFAPNHRVVCNLDRDIFVLADEDRIEQVLMNILTNATQHSQSGTTITVNLKTEDGAGVVEVRDEGAGIPGEKRKNLFDRFYQVEGERSRGLGLGLYISKQIVDQHGGKIRVESEEGSGSTFIFSLPLSGKDQKSSNPIKRILTSLSRRSQGV